MPDYVYGKAYAELIRQYDKIRKKGYCVDELIQQDIILTATEKHTLIGALCDKLKWLHDHGGTRADHIGLATRILDIAKSLPDDGDAA